MSTGFDPDKGPFGFHPDEWEQEIEKQVGPAAV